MQLLLRVFCGSIGWEVFIIAWSVLWSVQSLHRRQSGCFVIRLEPEVVSSVCAMKLERSPFLSCVLPAGTAARLPAGPCCHGDAQGLLGASCGLLHAKETIECGSGSGG